MTAIASTQTTNKIISGGEDGIIRVWKLNENSQMMESTMKEHKGRVNNIIIKKSNDNECVSCSEDGSCIIWDLKTFKRYNMMFSSTSLKDVTYHPDGSQLVTAGTDRKVILN